MAASPRKLLFTSTQQVIRLHRLSISNLAPSQPGLLESAVHSPIDVQHYTGEQNIFQLAAKLSEKIMKNHAFMDGNKRTGLLAADMFLRMNGYGLQQGLTAADDVNYSLADAQVAVTTNCLSAYELGRLYERIAKPVHEGDEIESRDHDGTT